MKKAEKEQVLARVAEMWIPCSAGGNRKSAAFWKAI